jgi:hypothetical protein
MITTQKELTKRVQDIVKVLWDETKTMYENGTTLLKASNEEAKRFDAMNDANEISSEAFHDGIQILNELNRFAVEVRKTAKAARKAA